VWAGVVGVSALPGTAHRTDTAAGAATGVEEVALVRLQAGDLRPLGHRQSGEHLAGLRIDAPDIGVGPLPGGMPQLTVHPGDAGDEAVRLEGAQDSAGLRVDLVDLPLPVRPHPERPPRPGQPGVAPASRCGDGQQHSAGGGIDLLNPVVGDLVEVAPVEGSASVARDVEGAAGLAGGGVDGSELLSGGEPDVPPVEGDPGHVRLPGKGSVLSDDLRGLLGFRHGPSYLNCSAPGSNKAVANPAIGAESQRWARPRPAEWTWPASSNVRRARWTVRWLDPSARASADVDHPSPSPSSATPPAAP